MTITAVGTQGGITTDTTFALTAITRAFGSNVAAGNLVVIACARESDSSQVWTAANCTKSAGTATIGAVTLDRQTGINVEGTDYLHVGFWSAIVTGAGSLTMSVANATGTYRGLTLMTDELNSTLGWDAGRAETGNQGGTSTNSQTTATTGNGTSAGASAFYGAFSDHSAANSAIGQDAAFTVVGEAEDGANILRASFIREIVSAGTTDSADWTMAATNNGWVAALQVYKEAASVVQLEDTLHRSAVMAILAM